ncbi:MAG: NAD(P)/FAD-dependent oxidoreductase [Pseudomonadota bacterium]
MGVHSAFDVAIIGSGPGGYRAAVLAAERGLRAAIVESHTWGGTCLNRGCVPKKAWHHTAQLIAQARCFARRGVQGELRADLAQAWHHQRHVVQTVRAGYTEYLARLGVKRFDGRARFADVRRLALDSGAEIAARYIIIATGSRPIFPDALPLTPERIISTDELFDRLPPPGKRVAVTGSGVIGAEFAFILAMLGLEVAWICRSRPLARARFSAAALRTLAQELERQGVYARTGARVAGAEIGADGVTLTLEDGTHLQADWVLAAAGRRPNSDGLGLAEVGIAVDADGFIRTDPHQRTSLPHVFAIGDVANREMSANQALAQAAVAIDNIVAPASRRHDPLAVPFLVYSALVAGRLGHTEEEIEDQGREPAVGHAAFEVNPRALGQDDTAGFVRLLADHDSGELLGAEIVGAEAGELINLVAQAYGRADALARLAALRYNHPARAEEIGNAVEALATKWGLAEKVFGAPTE